MQDMLPGVRLTILILLGLTVMNSSLVPIECRMTVNSSVLHRSSGLSMSRREGIGIGEYFLSITSSSIVPLVIRDSAIASLGRWVIFMKKFIIQFTPGILIHSVISSTFAMWLITSPPSMPLKALLERITKKRTKNKAKTTKPDSEWKRLIAHDNGVALDEEHCLFIVGGQDTAVNEDVESNQELPTATTKYHGKFLSSAYPAFDEASPSYVPTFNLRAQLRGSPEEIAEITRKKMNNKMKDPRKQLTPKQIFWSKDLIKMKAEALKEQTHKIFSDQQSDDYAILQIHLKACPQVTSSDAPAFESVFKIGNLKEQLQGRAVEASKRRRSLLDHKIQQLSKGSSEGSGIILEVPGEPKDNSGSSSNEILLKMNLPDHRSVLTDPEDQAKMEMETPRSSGVNSPPNAHT
ncbi:hypothetical protein Tco_0597076 [Tanacetum coccineum]